ncbi:hypothetical protein CDAR_168361 [Caerostris darwini]|uniref:Uncharacterized protein n=1 Tax=Caerostris darwini TaxID=1538125 RepID=A0AAV4T6L9_9ARAC|nr:hypothetical protein CDAR_168361 [Caerostris darwini]
MRSGRRKRTVSKRWLLSSIYGRFGIIATVGSFPATSRELTLATVAGAYNAAPATDKNEEKNNLLQVPFPYLAVPKDKQTICGAAPSAERERAHELTICKAGRTCLICELPRR